MISTASLSCCSDFSPSLISVMSDQREIVLPSSNLESVNKRVLPLEKFVSLDLFPEKSSHSFLIFLKCLFLSIPSGTTTKLLLIICSLN